MSFVSNKDFGFMQFVSFMYLLIARKGKQVESGEMAGSVLTYLHEAILERKESHVVIRIPVNCI